MSDPRNPPEEDVDLGEIEDSEETADDPQDQGAEDSEDLDAESPDDGAEDQDAEAETRVDRPRRGRASETIRSLRQRSQQAERELADLRRQTEDLQRQVRQPAPDPYAAARQAEAERQMLERMTPEEQLQHFRQRDRSEYGQALQGIEFRMADRLDKQAFDLAAQSSASRSRLAAKVEETLRSERSAGRNADREIIYKYLLGDEVDRRARSATPRQRGAAQRRIARQTTRPGSGRGDAARSGGGNRHDADEALLRGITLNDL